MNLPFKHCDLYNTIITSEKQDRKEKYGEKVKHHVHSICGKEKNILATAMETESPLHYGTGTADHTDHFQICSNVWNSDRI